MSSVKCLSGDCQRLPCRRGLCHNCYNRMLKRIRSGETTFDAEVASGRCLAANKAAMNPANGVLRRNR